MAVHKYKQHGIAELQKAIGQIANNMSPEQANSIFREAFETPAKEMAVKIRAKTPVKTGRLVGSVGTRTVKPSYYDFISVYVGYLDVSRRKIRYSQILSIEYGSARSRAYKILQTVFDSYNHDDLRKSIFDALEKAVRKSVEQKGRGVIFYSRF